MPSYKINNRRDEGRSGIGKIAASDNVYPHSKTDADGMRLRVTVPADRAGIKKAITRQDWEKQASLSRQLYGRVGEISGAIKQKALYSIGDAWCPKFEGINQADEQWGDLAEQWLDDYFPTCDFRGEPYDFVSSLFLDSIAIDRDGDSLAMRVMSNGRPQIQFLPYNRIASRYDWGTDSSGFGTMPKGSRWPGAKVYNGVVFSNSGTVMGYNILGETSKEDQQVSVGQAQLLYEPEWADQGRGIPRTVSSLLSWMDYEDIHHFLKRQVKQDSAQGILHYNDDGAAEDSKDFIEAKGSGEQNQDVSIEHLEGNEVMYFKALGGGKIEPFRSDRPHPNVDAYTMRILRGAMMSLGWFYELYDPTKIGGASTRLIQDQARAAIRERQKSIRKRAMFVIGFGLSFAIDKKELPPPPGGNFMRWGFTLPAMLTVDARHDEKTWTERLRNGGGTYMDYYGEKSQWWETKMRQRIREQAKLERWCKEEGVDVNKVQILTPNGNVPTSDESGGGSQAMETETEE